MAQGAGRKNTLIAILFFLLCGLDVMLTKIALNSGLCIEFNQIEIMQDLWWRLDIAILIILAFYLSKKQRDLGLLCFGMAWICGWNFSHVLLSL